MVVLYSLVNGKNNCRQRGKIVDADQISLKKIFRDKKIENDILPDAV